MSFIQIASQVASMPERAEKLKMVSGISPVTGKNFALIVFLDQISILEAKSASKIQAAFRSHQARLRLKKQAAWQIHEKLEYASEQTEAKVTFYLQ